jgi:hypothetical protein
MCYSYTLHHSTVGDEALGFMDRAFNNEIDYLIEATHADFTRINFRDGIHRAWFDMVIVRDFYRYVVLIALLCTQ